VYRFLDTAALFINTSNCDFVPGEEQLHSMTCQLKAINAQKDDRNKDQADGVIRLHGCLIDSELLLLETSSEFGNTDNTKIYFDHHKGMFGSLALLKIIADKYMLPSLIRFYWSIKYVIVLNI
jgi:hypothetical protein